MSKSKERKKKVRVLDITNGSRMSQTSAHEAHGMANGTMTKKLARVHLVAVINVFSSLHSIVRLTIQCNPHEKAENGA